MPNWRVSIAVLHERQPVIGVYTGVTGKSATLNGRTLTLDAARTIRNTTTGPAQ